MAEDHIRKSIELLNLQIQSKSRIHRCLGLEILRRENALNGINPEQFYSDYIRNDLCFNYPGLFCVTPYYIPKGDGGVRQLHFMEAPLRVLYYALGFYCLELTQTIRTQLAPINRNSSIDTHYGAKIRLDKPQKSQIYYKEDYQEFNRDIRQTVRRHVQQHKVAVLHIDIQDFFNSIDHSNLVEIIDSQATPESRLSLRYDESTKLAVRDILFLIMQRHEGLPLSKQNIVSNLLSHLFLCPVDNFMRRIQIDTLPSLTFHRYVDDMFVTVQFQSTETNENIGATMLNLSTNIGAFLSSNLDLRLNPLKTRLDIITSEDEVNQLIERSRLISFYNPLPEKKGESPQLTLNRAISVLNSMKTTFMKQGFVGRIATNDDLALKQCFQRAVTHYTQSEQARLQLETVFQNWNPALMPKSITILMFLVSRAPNALQILINYVVNNLNNTLLSLNTIYLAEHLMLLDQYNNQLNTPISNLLQGSSDPYIKLLSRLITPSIPANNSYIQIQNKCMVEYDSKMKQVSRTVLAEKLSLYSLAYNHLLNTFQEWCYCKQGKNIGRNNYDRNNVIDWLTPIADNDELTFIITLFDRRNRNTISHPGDEKVEVSPISKAEYEKHLRRLNLCLLNFSRRLSLQNQS
ncbi:MAG: hypothetical protein ACFCAD_28550 [Pleurocapsa sp.]